MSCQSSQKRRDDGRMLNTRVPKKLYTIPGSSLPEIIPEVTPKRMTAIRC